MLQCAAQEYRKWSGGQLSKRKYRKRSFSEIDRGPFGTAVFDARKRQCLTQAEVAKAIGRDRPWLSDVETGKISEIPDEDLEVMARILGFEVERLRWTRDSHSRIQDLRSTGYTVYVASKSCLHCNHPAEVDAKYCGSCGHKLELEVMCGTCSRRNSPGSNFCVRCGSYLDS